MKKFFKIYLEWVFLGICLCGMTSCRTAGQVAKNHEYVDPTQVKTEDEQESAELKKEAPNVDELRRQIAVLQGENESLRVAHSHELGILGQRITALEEENKKIKDSLVAVPIAAEAKPTNVEDLWLMATRNVQKRNYEMSAENFADLISRYPKSAWIFYSYLGGAMSLYGNGKYKEAALMFNQIIDRFPKKREASLAWFGQGSSFFKMGQKQDAKLFFAEIGSRFLKSEEAPLAKKILEKKSLPPSDLFVAFPEWAKYAPQPQ